MNLDDLTLLRGWIRHMEWADLDAQLAEDGGSSRKRIKFFRHSLAQKARFYGKTEWSLLWLGERLPVQSWERRALAALAELNTLPDPIPALEHHVAQWFSEALCAALPVKVLTLADLVDWLEAYFAGETRLRPESETAVKAFVRFLDSHSQVLGYRLNKKPRQPTLPVPLQAVAPLERVFIPIELNGENGSNRSGEPCRINAIHDLDAIKSWLSLKGSNPKTWQSYKKELERLLLWSVLERRKAVSSLNSDDCQAYIRFLKSLTTADNQWVTMQPANKSHGKWKPFYYRSKKGKAAAPLGETGQPQRVLSAKSINYAKTVISTCMSWLVKQNYLKHNNFEDIQAIKSARSSIQTNNRAFTLEQMQKIFVYAAQQTESDMANFWLHRRNMFILKFAFNTGLRIHELAAASYGDIECLEDASGEQYFLNVTGKHGKLRKTSLPGIFIEELKDYLALRRLPCHFDFLPPQAPLINSLRDKTGRKHLTPAGIHKILANFFEGMFKSLEETDNASDKRFIAKLRNASAHWLRHSYGSYLANDKQVPLAYIRDELGHANISTTSLYLNSDAKQRQKVVSDAFSGI